MRWTDKDLERLKGKGLKVVEQIKEKPEVKVPVKANPVKISVEKRTIELLLSTLKQQGMIPEYVTELRFDTVRRFRFDWAIPSLKIAIEYEGIYSEKSGHTTMDGYTKDAEKYNLAVSLGWRVLRYTAKNYKDLEADLNKLLLDK